MCAAREEDRWATVRPQHLVRDSGTDGLNASGSDGNGAAACWRGRLRGAAAGVLAVHPLITLPSTQREESGEGQEVAALRKKKSHTRASSATKGQLATHSEQLRDLPWWPRRCRGNGAQHRGQQSAPGVQRELPRQKPWPGRRPAGCGFWGLCWGSQLSQPPRPVQRSTTGLQESCAARCVSQVREEALPGAG